jgi:hypothetical protein
MSTAASRSVSSTAGRGAAGIGKSRGWPSSGDATNAGRPQVRRLFAPDAVTDLRKAAFLQQISATGKRSSSVR